MAGNVSFQNPNMTVPSSSAHEHSPGQVLEAYTVVLSVTCHLLSLLFGGGSSLAVIVAIISRRNVSKYSYLLILCFLGGCCSLNFVYSPMEIVDLLMYHGRQLHPARHFVAAKTVMFILFLALINVAIAFLAAEGLLRASNRYYTGVLQRIWPATSTVTTLVVSLIFAVSLIDPATDSSGSTEGPYAPMHLRLRSPFLTLVAILFIAATLAFVILVVTLIHLNVYWEDGKPHFRKKKLKLAVPEFLISQSNNACDEVESGFDNDFDPSRTPSPSTPKLLTVCEQVKGEDAAPIPDLPQTTPTKASGKHLGINMSQVLGRRRHTICQISDSSSPSAAPADPIVKAKQYNYVRKFSVDISALQAQLQNPKIFNKAPFQSDIDLAKKAEGANPPPKPKPLLPLKPLNSKPETEENADKPETPTLAPMPISPPPVIMVSNDDTFPDNEDGDADADAAPEITVTPLNVDGLNGKTETFVTQPAITIQKPATLSLKDNCNDDFTSAPTLESAITDTSEVESENQRMIRLALCMSLTFVITVLPVLITESLRQSLSEHAFVNISTCTVAISTIQTIVYPNILVCLDDVIHKSVQKLKKRAGKLFMCRLENQHTHVEDTSSTSQV